MIIITNDNGDWWSVDETMYTTLWILDTDKITDKEVLLEMADWAGIDLEWDDNDEVIVPENIHDLINEELPHQDKLERLAWEFGKTKLINVSG